MADPPKGSLVVFDTNVIEGRYLLHLLKGERCRDFEILRALPAQYVPAFYVKSFYEICAHCKSGEPGFLWMREEFGYPGGRQVGREILRRGLSGKTLSDADLELQFNWLFGLSEEWRGLDWDERESVFARLVVPEERFRALEELRIQRQFAEWKFRLTAFCERIWNVLAENMKAVMRADVYGTDRTELRTPSSLEWELCLRSLVPSEDLEIVVAALAMKVAAFVTCEKKILNQTGLSASLNYQTSFVHPDHLLKAAEGGFEFRWSPDQTTQVDGKSKKTRDCDKPRA